eukprot:INCI4073.4.p1 GENE.INCI4073.4~~INCI4073.4.p1  ORF type:complete len:618 (+),score=90.95 INCI4073.4:104-1957(+)
MGASCARLCAGEGDEWQIPSDGTSSPGVQMGDLNSQPFLTLKSRDPEALEKTLVAADALLAACDWVLKAPLPERYVVGKALGKGATGIVMRATRRSDGLLCAIKSVPKVSLPSVDTLLAEMAILRKLDHPNVVKCLDTIDDGVRLHAVLENCSGGDLFDWFLSLPRYSEQTIAGIVSDITGAVSHCHQHGIVHRDIKPENILFFAPARGSMSGRGGRFATVKLCDFGCAFQLDANFDPTASANLLTQAQMKSMVGSSYYVAPEVLRQDSNYTAAVDLWSLGVITFLLVLGFPPFDGDSEIEIQASVLRGIFSFSGSSRLGNRSSTGAVSIEARDFVSALLQRDPAARLSASQAMRHPWLKGVGSGAVTPPSRWRRRAAPHKEQFEGVARRIKEFSALPQVKRTILAALAKQLTEEQARAQTRDFRKIDNNRDGQLGLEEMKRVGVDTPTVRRIGGHLTYSEWLAATTDVTFHDDVLRRFFDHFDTGGTGWVSLVDIETRLAKDSNAMNVRRQSLRGTAVSPRVASQKMVDFPQFKKFLRARSQRLSQALSPNGEHHLADVVVEVYPDDQVGKSSAEAKSGGTVAIPQVVALGSPPQRKLVSRISSSAVAEATTEIDL